MPVLGARVWQDDGPCDISGTAARASEWQACRVMSKCEGLVTRFWLAFDMPKPKCSNDPSAWASCLLVDVTWVGMQPS